MMFYTILCRSILALVVIFRRNTLVGEFDTLSMKTLSLGDETILETLNCAILIDRNRRVLGANFKTQMVHAACRCCFIYELYDMFFKRSSPL